MTKPLDRDPALDVPMWRALDLQRAYAYRDRGVAATILDDLDGAQLGDLVGVLIDMHNQDLTDLSSLGAAVAVSALRSEFDQVAACAPAESEFAITTVLRDVAGGADMTAALKSLAPVARAHLLAAYVTAMNVSAFGRAGCQRRLEATAEITEQDLGKPRPYPQPLPAGR
ncbi:hypothetical protein [Amycolatopsis rubida]|uniref:hypothetical protein n=1 Tax=Amycolatopsis rubida TaxID=112413 RepID=UPI001160D0C4|nr:hypothetical protein [Amycolatopsis rubida]